MEIENTADVVLSFVAVYGLKVVAAIIILAVGTWLAKKLKSLATAAMTKKAVDPTLVSFFSNLLYGAVLVFVVIAAIDKLGVNITSFAAVLAAVGLAIGMALSGSLSNFAAGVLLILFKPFRVGHFVKVGGEMGTVVEVGLLVTELKSPENIQVLMPNSAVMSGTITNFSVNDTRRVDMVIGVGYGDDLAKTKRVIEEMLLNDPRVLADPAPFVGVSNLGDSRVDFTLRPWTKSSDLWQFKCDFTQAVKERFDAEGISIPFPQRDVHLIKDSDG